MYTKLATESGACQGFRGQLKLLEVLNGAGFSTSNNIVIEPRR